ncbi:MAG: hypothetical protein B7C24_15345 [Bacteroidetes bacterium 4572_77]|nr:MAG: hypothetical protein B7C24_15345 [Bacteroidetes bacterium 4572_77]
MVYTYDENTYSDLHKDVYGVRPRSDHFYNATPDQKQIIWDGLLESLTFEMKEDAKREVQAIDDFEKEISRNMSLGAPDRKTAIRWITQALDVGEGDSGYFCYELGLPYTYAPEFGGM